MPKLQRIPADRAVDQGLCCSFCGQEPADGSDLIGGSDVFICDECLARCNEMVVGGREVESPAADAEEAEIDAAPARRQTFFRLLTDGDVEALLPMDMMIVAMEGALRRISTGGAVQPMRTVIPIGHEFFAAMPVYIPSPAALGAKLVTAFSSNAALDLPTHLATVLLFSPETGALLAVLGGNYITEART